MTQQIAAAAEDSACISVPVGIKMLVNYRPNIIEYVMLGILPFGVLSGPLSPMVLGFWSCSN